MTERRAPKRPREEARHTNGTAGDEVRTEEETGEERRMKRRITEYLDVDLERMEWSCNRCGHTLGPAAGNYKHGCAVAQRSPHEVWRPLVDEAVTFSYHPGWARLVEFYCPGCATLLEVEMLPPGHPVTHDIELDLDALRAAVADGEAR